MVVTREIKVLNVNGLHARPAMAFVDVANAFQSKITVVNPGGDPPEVDGKSIMGMIMLGAAKGTLLKISADGSDAEAAVKKLVELFESKFGEE